MMDKNEQLNMNLTAGLPRTVVAQMMERIPGGFFIYRADGDEDFLLVNSGLVKMYGCDSKEEFLRLTGGSFRGFVYPEDLNQVEASISEQISSNEAGIDQVEYRIVRKDGQIRWLRDYGRIVETDEHDRVFYVFVTDDTDAHAQRENPAQIDQSPQGFRKPGSEMPRSEEKTGRNKKKILVVEDSELNREILISILSDGYDILQAENGLEGIRMLKQHREELSLVLLDVYMPVCDGFEFLEQTRSDPYLASVPVIVTTSSNLHEDEVRSLRLGAADFITKPYYPESLLGRIHNVIRLRESISTLSVVEYDDVTSLYNMSAFYHYASQMMQKEQELDLSVVEIQDLSAIVSIYGEKNGKAVLKYTAGYLRQLMPTAMIARNDNLFYVLVSAKHRIDPEQVRISCDSAGSVGQISNIRVRVGLYYGIDITQPIAVLCQRVKMVTLSINRLDKDFVAIYDKKMEARRISEQKLLLAFDQALANREFVIRVQPKVDVETEQIVGAEALLRWITKEGVMISPADFIPLFEREGQVRLLDEHVFRRVCSFQHERQKKGKKVIPISVNLSRGSLFSEGIVEQYRRIAEEEAVDLSLVPIEITETAATSALRTQEICEQFVQAGFILHMDDFGTGYSSFSSLATLPFSVLKLDKSLIDQIGTKKGNIIIKNIVDTAQDLGMEVIAEGVEQKEQVEFLALISCNVIQGYYYAAPMQPETFMKLTEEAYPFTGKEKITSLHTGGVIKITSTELKRYLKVCRIVFPGVRILDEDCCTYCMATERGELLEAESPCYQIWKKNSRCVNCISRRALETRKTLHKFEVFENEIYIVYSLYLEVDGQPRVLELFSPVGEDILHGYQEHPTLLEAIHFGDLDKYTEQQLGILNRRFFEEQGVKLKNISAVALIDVDHFKEINDTYGHDVGDLVLKRVVDQIRTCIREHDYMIRMGGDEFLITFVGMKNEYLMSKLDDIRKSVEEISIEGYPDLMPTITIGGCVCTEFMNQILEVADRALYEGKRSRNTVIIRYENAGR